jgi:hypothetical protein
MTDIASLSFNVDSSGLARANEQMVKLVEQSRRLADENRRLQQQLRDVTREFNTFADSQNRAYEAAKGRQPGLMTRALDASANAINFAFDVPNRAAGYAGQQVGGFFAGTASVFGQVGRQAVRGATGFDPGSVFGGGTNFLGRAYDAAFGPQRSSVLDELNNPNVKAFMTEMRLLATAAGDGLRPLMTWKETLKDAGQGAGEAARYMAQFNRQLMGQQTPLQSAYMDKMGVSGPYFDSQDLAARIADKIRAMPVGAGRTEATETFFGPGVEGAAAVQFLRSRSPAMRLADTIDSDLVLTTEQRRMQVEAQNALRAQSGAAAAERLRASIPDLYSQGGSLLYQNALSQIGQGNFGRGAQGLLLSGASYAAGLTSSFTNIFRSDESIVARAEEQRRIARGLMESGGVTLPTEPIREIDPAGLRLMYANRLSDFAQSQNAAGNYGQWSIDLEQQFWEERRAAAEKGAKYTTDAARDIETRLYEARRAANERGFRLAMGENARFAGEANFVGSVDQTISARRGQITLLEAMIGQGQLEPSAGNSQIADLRQSIDFLRRSFEAGLTGAAAGLSIGGVQADVSVYGPQAQAAYAAGRAPATAIIGGQIRGLRESSAESGYQYQAQTEAELRRAGMSPERARAVAGAMAAEAGRLAGGSARISPDALRVDRYLAPGEFAPDSLGQGVGAEALRQRGVMRGIQAMGASAGAISNAIEGQIVRQERIFDPRLNPYAYTGAGDSFTSSLRMSQAQVYAQGIDVGAGDLQRLVRMRTTADMRRMASDFAGQTAGLEEDTAIINAVTAAVPGGSGAMARARISATNAQQRAALLRFVEANGLSRAQAGPLYDAVNARSGQEAINLDARDSQAFEMQKKAREQNTKLIELEFSLLGRANSERARMVEYERALVELREKYPNKASDEIAREAEAMSKAAAARVTINEAQQSAAQYAQAISINTERAILNFTSLRDVAYSVARDLQTVILRQTVTMPLQNALTGAIAQTGATAASQNLFSSAFSWIGSGIKGLFGFADGGVMTSSGPVRAYASGGVANSPQIAIYGEGRTPEAYIPMEDGRTVPLGVRSNGSIYVRLPGGRSIPASIKSSNFADGGVMTPSGPVEISSPSPGTSVTTSGTKFETNVTVNMSGGSGNARSDGDEVGKRVSAEVSRMMRSIVAEELRRQMRPGAMLNPGV